MGLHESSPRQSLMQWSESQKAIQAADPLRADTFFKNELPRMNFYQNSDDIAYASRELVPSGDTIDAYTMSEARAAKRDLGFVATSLLFHEGDVGWVEGMEDALRKLSQRTGDPPAHTIFDYTVYNPSDTRRRTFTGTPEEKQIIELTSHGTESLSKSMLYLHDASETTIFDPNYSSAVTNAAINFQPMIESMVSVRRSENLVSVFTKDIQPYFMKKISVDGEVYGGAGGGQIPLYIVDKIVGTSPQSTEAEKRQHDEYFSDNIRYAPKEIKVLGESVRDKRSLIEGAVADSKNALEERSEDEIHHAGNSLRALREMLLQISQFRNPHSKVVKDSMQMREVKEGSGGYDEEMVDWLKDSTREVRQQLDKAAQNLQVSDWRYTFR